MIYDPPRKYSTISINGFISSNGHKPGCVDGITFHKFYLFSEAQPSRSKLNFKTRLRPVSHSRIYFQQFAGYNTYFIYLIFLKY